jgi:hypothetical protein
MSSHRAAGIELMSTRDLRRAAPLPSSDKVWVELAPDRSADALGWA